MEVEGGIVTEVERSCSSPQNEQQEQLPEPFVQGSTLLLESHASLEVLLHVKDARDVIFGEWPLQ